MLQPWRNHFCETWNDFREGFGYGTVRTFHVQNHCSFKMYGISREDAKENDPSEVFGVVSYDAIVGVVAVHNSFFVDNAQK